MRMVAAREAPVVLAAAMMVTVPAPVAAALDEVSHAGNCVTVQLWPVSEAAMAIDFWLPAAGASQVEGCSRWLR